MSTIVWTNQQRTAIETVDRSTLVSAAAGSGKTAVLAARCVYLVCDAPPPFRCNVDELLVVTFTDAAAAEMRARIIDGLRRRAGEHPADTRVRRQAALVDTARIGTIHAFCLSIVREWFHRVGVDAAAQLLDADESELIKDAAIERVLECAYADTGEAGDRFRLLVALYGRGYDRLIASFVRRAADFCDSLVDPDAWLDHAADYGPDRWSQAFAERCAALGAELARQVEHHRAIAARLGDRFPVAEPLAAYLNQTADFLAGLCDAHAVDDPRWWDDVHEKLSGGCGKVPRQPRGFGDDEKDQWKRAKDYQEKCTKQLKTRVLEGLSLFDADSLRETFERTAPHVRCLVDLVRRFRAEYDAVKHEQGVMDFADLERLTYLLLTKTLRGEAVSPVAAQLRRRYAHVLVDEFQDVNPLQAEIIRQVSRETLADHTGNLFAVGDVKQSIYRFRLAEPKTFVARQRLYADAGTPQRLVAMQSNFRSTPRVIEAVNAVFAAMMKGHLDDIVYDDDALLIPTHPDDPRDQPCELHIIDRNPSFAQGEDDEETEDSDDTGAADVIFDPDDPTQWPSVEREAYLISRRIRALVDAGFQVRDGDTERTIQYGDIGVLLRSPRHVAARVAAMLCSMGVTAWADTGHDLFDTTEVADVLSLLAVIDNLQQDIALAAVLRSGILGDRFTESELVAARVRNRHRAFCDAVRAYARHGPDGALRGRYHRVIESVYAYRRRMRVEPVADVLWRIYVETGYLSYVRGLRGGRQRHANLIALHELARRFGSYRRQGLARFLRFVEQMRDRAGSGDTTTPMSDARDAVRIMSIHRSKGLEFPVVFVADMGRRFNRTDANGAMLLERDTGIGLRVVDRDRMIEYPTILHDQCAHRTLNGELAEEMRVLYVAMTRAKQKLILIGSEPFASVDRWIVSGQSYTNRVSEMAALTAHSPLHWLIAALASLPKGRAGGPTESCDDQLVVVHRHGASDIRGFIHPSAAGDENARTRGLVAALKPLPPGEPVSGDLTTAERTIDRLTRIYPQLGVTSVRAAISASEADRSSTVWTDPGDDAVLRVGPSRPAVDDSDALRRGRTVHRVLQWIDLDAHNQPDGVERAVQMLVDRGLVDAADTGLIDADALRWFLLSPPAQRARSALQYHREWMFLSSVPVIEIDPTATDDEGERVLVRGVVDGLIEQPDHLGVIDFKTDNVTPAQVQERARRYALQLRLYARAAADAVGKPVRGAHLVFLAARRVVDVEVGQ